MDLDQARREYLGYLAVERGYSHNTIDSYARDIKRYLAFLAARGISRPDDVSRGDVVDHIQGLEESGLAPSSVKRAVSAIKGFHRFMVVEQICENHPTADVPLPKEPERLPDVLSREDVFRLLDVPFAVEPKPKPRKGGEPDRTNVAAFHRDKAILEVLYGCGLRVSELCGLDLADVSFEDEMLRVTGKGSGSASSPSSWGPRSERCGSMWRSGGPSSARTGADRVPRCSRAPVGRASRGRRSTRWWSGTGGWWG